MAIALTAVNVSTHTHTQIILCIVIEKDGRQKLLKEARRLARDFLFTRFFSFWNLFTTIYYLIYLIYLIFYFSFGIPFLFARFPFSIKLSGRVFWAIRLHLTPNKQKEMKQEKQLHLDGWFLFALICIDKFGIVYGAYLSRNNNNNKVDSTNISDVLHCWPIGDGISSAGSTLTSVKAALQHKPSNKRNKRNCAPMMIEKRHRVVVFFFTNYKDILASRKKKAVCFRA